MVVRIKYEPNRGNYGKRKIQYRERCQILCGGSNQRWWGHIYSICAAHLARHGCYLIPVKQSCVKWLWVTEFRNLWTTFHCTVMSDWFHVDGAWILLASKGGQYSGKSWHGRVILVTTNGYLSNTKDGQMSQLNW